VAQQHLGANLTGFELMSEVALNLVVRHFPQFNVPMWAHMPYYVLLETSDHESEQHAREQFEQLLANAIEQGFVQEAIVPDNLAQARHFWEIRESISAAQSREGLNIKHDISVPVSAMAPFVKRTDALLTQRLPGVRLVNFGHMGDGNLHYNVQAPEGVDAAQFLAAHETQVNEWVYEQVLACGGSISAEHGIGSLKAQTLPKYKDPVALALMRQIKQALDPLGILNPARVLCSADHHEA
jgi:FAD/FMN-containing dehydrogenase